MKRVGIVVALVTVLFGTARAEAPVGQRVSSEGMVIAGPRVTSLPRGPVAVWIEEPKTLVVAWLDERGRVAAREEHDLAGDDAAIVDLLPFGTLDGSLAVALLEKDVSRLGEDVPLRRISLRRMGENERKVQIIAEGRDDGTGEAPTSLIAAGLYTTSRYEAVVWRRNVSDRAAVERRAPPASLSIVRPEEVTTSDILGETRTATAAAWTADGGVHLAASDAGRPVVITPQGEVVVDVPTPALLSSLVGPPGGRISWMAAGLDANKRVFVVAGRSGSSSTTSFLLPVSPLIEAPPDLADAGTVIGAPMLIVRPGGTRLLWPSRAAGLDEIRWRPVDEAGLPSAASRTALACPTGHRLIGADATGSGSQLIVAATCARGGKADVFVTVVKE